jgi:exodeoxyribonuclease-3
MDELREAGFQVAVGGDYNTAHKDFDLSRPDRNSKVSGFLPEEREWVDNYIEAGWLDTYRLVRPEERDVWSWWSWRANSRERNVGWRIDYWFVGEEMRELVKDAAIHPDVLGSDHAPVTLVLDL